VYASISTVRLFDALMLESNNMKLNRSSSMFNYAAT